MTVPTHSLTRCRQRYSPVLPAAQPGGSHLALDTKPFDIACTAVYSLTTDTLRCSYFELAPCANRAPHTHPFSSGLLYAIEGACPLHFTSVRPSFDAAEAAAPEVPA